MSARWPGSIRIVARMFGPSCARMTKVDIDGSTVEPRVSFVHDMCPYYLHHSGNVEVAVPV